MAEEKEYTGKKFSPFTFQNENDCVCKDCMFREKDIVVGTKVFYGSTKCNCKKYDNKPLDIIMCKRHECKYYKKG